MEKIIRLALVPALLFSCSQSEVTEQIAAKEEQASQGLQVQIGPSPIPRGDALGKQDITISNQFFALSFGVDTASPWGVAKGGILDIGVFRDGQLEADFVSLVDFMPNYWSAWPSSYQSTKLIESTPQKVVVQTRRDWAEVTLETNFEVSSNSNLVRILTVMRNAADKSLPALTTGYIAWPNGGHLFGMPGITEGDSRPIPESPALAKWSASYDEGWSLGQHTTFSDHVAYTGRDRYLKHDLEPGQSREFETWLQIEPNADLTRFVARSSQLSGTEQGTVKGRVVDQNSDALNRGVVIINQGERLYAWSLLKDSAFEFDLPVGDYQVYATAAGYSSGRIQDVKVQAKKIADVQLDQVQPPGSLSFSIVDADTSEALDAMIGIREGTKPLLGYFGKARFFTSLLNPGKVQIDVAPGEYQFDVSSGGGFLAAVQTVSAQVVSGQKTDLLVGVTRIDSPAKRDWLSADLHHHSDVLDGFTNPEFVMKSQLAAQLDVTFLSDHDSTQNNREMQTLSQQRNLSFIPGTELSASWGHFNAYPIDYDLQPRSDVGLGSVQELFAEARRLGASVVHVNHPFGNYGYFDSLQQEKDEGLKANSIVPGGYDAGFDLIEITTQHDTRTLERAWQLWNKGKPAYFAAGSDVHDVWNTPSEYSSGAARSYVFLDQGKSAEDFVAGLKAGHSYATQGPLIYPEQLFGTELSATANQNLTLAYELQSVIGLNQVQLIERGQVINTRQILKVEQGTALVPIEFEVSPQQDTWYSLVVSDIAGNYAYSNPLWVKLKNN